MIFFSCSISILLHFHQDLPHCPLSSVPVNAVLLLHFATSGALKASHQRLSVGISAIGFSLVTFYGIKKNIVVHACCGHFPLCSTFSVNSTISPLVSFVKATPVFALKNLETFSKTHAYNIGSASSNFLSSLFPNACPPSSARFRHTATALPILSSLLHSGPKALRPLLPSPRSALLLSMLRALLRNAEAPHYHPHS